MNIYNVFSINLAFDKKYNSKEHLTIHKILLSNEKKISKTQGSLVQIPQNYMKSS